MMSEQTIKPELSAKSGLTIKIRMYLNLGILAVALIVVCFTGLNAFNTVSKRLEAMYAEMLKPIAEVGEIYQRSLQSQQYRLEAYVHRDPAFTKQNYDAIKANRARINELMERFDQLQLTAQEGKLAAEVREQRAQLVSLGKEEIEALLAGDYDTAAKIRLAKIEPVIDRMDPTTEELAQLRIKLAEDMLVEARKEIGSGRVLIISSFVVALLIASVFAWLLVRHVTRGLAQAENVAQRVSRGELGQRLEITGHDEIARVLLALKEMDAQLLHTIVKVRAGASEVDHAARQLSEGSDELNERTQRQAAALEETAASIEEMTATVKQNEDNAKQASQLATGTRSQADQGGTVVKQAIEAMGQITSSSKRIGDIIGVIDEIAFQTNLLALNAAVEAARAGEQGRGFAVVATEVRALAQRSASAAKEIKELINDSVSKIGAGAELVDTSGRKLDEIVAGVKKVTDIVAEMAAATEEQSSGINQINQAIASMDATTQQNAALVEESTSAAKQMQQQAYELQQLVAFFRIDGTTAETVSAVTAAPPVRKQSAASAANLTTFGSRKHHPARRAANG
jgi:methyl-accepting chemotaxis protein